MNGGFITFEGGDGSGKTTQVKLLAEYLSSRKIETVVTKEPGGTPIGKELRALLCTGDKDKFDAVAETLLYYADRRIHLQQKVWPAIKQGKWVISDRFADSTTAYQYYGYDKQLSSAMLDELYKMTVGDFYPDLTIILDIDPAVGLSRSMARCTASALDETRQESRGLAFHRNLRQGFLEIAKTAPRYVVIDANRPAEVIHHEVVSVVNKRLFNAG